MLKKIAKSDKNKLKVIKNAQNLQKNHKNINFFFKDFYYSLINSHYF